MVYAAALEDKDAVEFRGFLGLRNNVPVEHMGLEDLVTATDVDILDSLKVRRRKGHGAVLTAAVDRDIYGSGSTLLGVGSNTLKLVKADWTTTSLRTGLTSGRPMTYTSIADRVFWSNGAELGVVQNGADRTWGLDVPGAPALAATAGTLPAGRYQVVLTYLRDDGQESGAGRAAVIELTDTGGIALSAIPVSTDASVTYKVIYVSPRDGETLFRYAVIANAQTTLTVADAKHGTAPLQTQFLTAPPAGDFIAQWRGWMLVAKDNRLYPSEPYAPELFDPRKSYPFPDRITMVAPLTDRTSGVWIGTETSVVWLEGDSPEAWRASEVASYGVVPGTLAFFDGDLTDEGGAAVDTSAYFWTTQGACLARASGAFVNMTQNRWAAPKQERGCGVVRRHAGTIQYLASLRGAETAGNVFA